MQTRRCARSDRVKSTKWGAQDSSYSHWRREILAITSAGTTFFRTIASAGSISAWKKALETEMNDERRGIRANGRDFDEQDGKPLNRH
jgi:hypothetical protein